MKKFPDLKPGQQHTLDTIYERCVEECDCWMWQAGKSHGSPAIRFDGQVIHLRRYILEQLQKKKLKPGIMAHMRCGNLECVNPAHIIQVTRQELQKITADRTQYGLSQTRSMKLAQRKQAVSSLTWDIVRTIRTMEGSHSGISRELGIPLSTVIDIRKHKTWKETSPFLGLIGMGR